MGLEVEILKGVLEMAIISFFCINFFLFFSHLCECKPERVFSPAECTRLVFSPCLKLRKELF